MLNNLNPKRTLLTLGAASDLPSYRYSQLDRGVIEACILFGKKSAADLALRAGLSVRAVIRLLQIADRQS